MTSEIWDTCMCAKQLILETNKIKKTDQLMHIALCHR